MISKLIIIGAGALGREVYSLVQDINDVKRQFDVIGFLDDGAEVNSTIRNVKVLGTSDSISMFESTQFIIAIGNPKLRNRLFEKVKKSGATLPNLIHPKAKIDAFFASNWETIEGNIICSNSVLSCDVNLGNNNLINIATVLSHDTQVGNHNTIMQGCVINGFVRIGNECLFSPGVKVSGSFYFEKDFIKQNLDNY